MELRKYKKTYSTGDLQVTDSTVKVKFEVSQYQESRNWKKFKCMELATGTEIGNDFLHEFGMKTMPPAIFSPI
jgi:hypothetical protein